MKVKRVDYKKLSTKQKEIYNFQKLAGVLAEYGFNCIKLHDDWQGADFLAYHKDGKKTLKVQLKGNLHIAKKYQGKEIHMAFRVKGTWYLVPHDELVKMVKEAAPSWLESKSWKQGGGYGSTRPSQKLMDRLSEYTLKEQANPLYLRHDLNPPSVAFPAA